MGAYDECIETVVQNKYGTTKVRGQYCDLHLSLGDDDAFLENLLPTLSYSHKKVSVQKPLFYNCLSRSLFKLFPAATKLRFEELVDPHRGRHALLVAFCYLSGVMSDN